MRPSDQRGFTLVEMLLVMSLFSLISVGFYQVMVSGNRGSNTARSVVRVSEEARLGFNRMVRDTREAVLISCAIACPTSTSYHVLVDFNGDGSFGNPNSLGDYEDLTFTFVGDEIRLNGETLIDGVSPIPGHEIFSYSSNQLQYDWDGDGITTWQELDEANCPEHNILTVGDCDGTLDTSEASHLTSVSFALRVTSEDRTSEFYAEAQLRNRR